jgi:hypothetical protein
MSLPGDATGHHAGGTRSRFVLVCAPNHEGQVHPPQSLRNALTARDAEVVIRTSAYDAMADLIEHELALRAHERREAMVLLIIEPDALPHARDLVAAAARYTPHAVCWRYSEADEPQLRAFPYTAPGAGGASESGPPTPPTITIRPGVAHVIAPRRRRHIEPTPKLRLTGEPDDVESDEPPSDQGPAEPEKPILSDEELEILLSDDWEGQTREGGPA